MGSHEGAPASPSAQEHLRFLYGRVTTNVTAFCLYCGAGPPLKIRSWNHAARDILTKAVSRTTIFLSHKTRKPRPLALPLRPDAQSIDNVRINRPSHFSKLLVHGCKRHPTSMSSSAPVTLMSFVPARAGRLMSLYGHARGSGAALRSRRTTLSSSRWLRPGWPWAT